MQVGQRISCSIYANLSLTVSKSINADIGHTTLWCCEYSDVVMTVKKCKSGESSINWKSARTDFTTLTCARRSYMYSNITCVGKVSRKTISRKAKAQSPADTERLVVPHVGPWRCCRCRANDGLQLVTDVRWVCWLHSRLLNTYHCRSAAAWTCSLWSSQYPSLQVSSSINLLFLTSHRPRLRSGSCHYHILLTVPQLPSHILQLR